MAGKFESSVISYGSEAGTLSTDNTTGFESSVISYGSEAPAGNITKMSSFESSVISYGSEACDRYQQNV